MPCFFFYYYCNALNIELEKIFRQGKILSHNKVVCLMYKLYILNWTVVIEFIMCQDLKCLDKVKKD